ncbi:hypothetical protein [Streptomyces sp. NPDC094049]|uniref:hypothetical protein n=1 Tax=Streptomyces sp. NPDC094049 TaxID=3154987 RepID=UPI00332117C7
MAQAHIAHSTTTKVGIALGVLAAAFAALALHSTTAPQASDRQTGTVKPAVAADRENGTVKPALAADREIGTVKWVTTAKTAGDKKVEVIK